MPFLFNNNNYCFLRIPPTLSRHNDFVPYIGNHPTKKQRRHPASAVLSFIIGVFKTPLITSLLNPKDTIISGAKKKKKERLGESALIL